MIKRLISGIGARVRNTARGLYENFRHVEGGNSMRNGMRHSVFTISNPEGEIYRIDTNDPRSPFYGPGWQRVFEAHENGEFLRGRAAVRRLSREDRFSGYTLHIDGDRGLSVFLPASRAGYFRDPANDASEKFVAFKIKSIHPTGARAGTIIADAGESISYVSSLIPDPSCLGLGAEVWAVSVDHGEGMLGFPIRTPHNSMMIYAHLDHAAQVAYNCGMPYDPDCLTGCFWRLQVVDGGNGWRMALPLEAVC